MPARADPPRRPHFRAAALFKSQQGKGGNVGGAWKNDDGTISLILDPFIVLSQTNNKDLLVTLFPISEEDRKKPMRPRDDDIPF